MQHDVLAFLHLLHAIDAQGQTMYPLLLFSGHRYGRANDRGLTFEYRLCFPEMISDKSRTRRYEIADEIRSA